ncbi:ABC transporter ATP-binding protein [Cerasicoccus maritimus]|uniref:ABC transporter ATP-binding protein n=1 Tax=Cerasicoccus maritimus TaxID=490089 RepID=UPI002852BC28|nr:ABC transporter ATP-binding protein [Cerasicoccus maritimus]
MKTGSLSEAPSFRSFLWACRRSFRNYLNWRICSVLCVAPYPAITNAIIEHGLKYKDAFLCVQLTAVSLLLLAVHALTMIKCAKEMANATQVMVVSMRREIFTKLQMMHFGYIDKMQAGRLLSKYAIDSQNIEMAVMPLMSMVAPELVRTTLLITVLGVLNPWLLIFVVIALPLVVLVRVLFWNRLQRINERVRRDREQLTGFASEFIGAIKLTRSYGQEHRVVRDMETVSQVYGDSRCAQIHLDQTFGWTMFVILVAIEVLAIGFGSLLVLKDLLTLGALVALVGTLPIIVAPVNILSQFGVQYLQAKESFRSIKELVDSDYTEQWNGETKPLIFEGKIELRNVSFRYEETTPCVINHVSLAIEPGQHIALVGASGSGKSTLVNLVLGLYSTTEGEIAIDGVSIEDLDLRAFRRRCSVVMQDNLLISGSIAENMRFGKPEATDEELVLAAKAANAWEFIKELPEGLQYQVGERGSSLSGGQRQRIAISRAILRDPILLVLDEATSALDNESEALVQEAVKELSRNRTTITIAHRLSTIRDADMILVMEGGQIVEAGSYDDLAAAPGSFSKLLAASRSEC